MIELGVIGVYDSLTREIHWGSKLSQRGKHAFRKLFNQLMLNKVQIFYMPLSFFK